MVFLLLLTYFSNSKTNSDYYKNCGEWTKKLFMNIWSKSLSAEKKSDFLHASAKIALTLEGLWWRCQCRARASQQTEAAFRLLPARAGHRLAAEGKLCLHPYDSYAELSLPIGCKYFRGNFCWNWIAVKKKHWDLWNSLAYHLLLAIGWTILPALSVNPNKDLLRATFVWHTSLEITISTSPSARV